MSIIERALAKAKHEDRAAVEDAEGLAHRPAGDVGAGSPANDGPTDAAFAVKPAPTGPALAAGVERASEHPLALAIVEAAKARSLAIPDVRDFDSPTGRGALGDVCLLYTSPSPRD